MNTISIHGLVLRFLSDVQHAACPQLRLALPAVWDHALIEPVLNGRRLDVEKPGNFRLRFEVLQKVLWSHS